IRNGRHLGRSFEFRLKRGAGLTDRTDAPALAPAPRRSGRARASQIAVRAAQHDLRHRPPPAVEEGPAPPLRLFVVLVPDRPVDLDHQRLVVVGPELVFDALHTLFRWLHFLTPALTSSAVKRRSRSAVSMAALASFKMAVSRPAT